MTMTKYAGRSSARCGVKSSPHTEQRLSTFRKARNNLPSPQRGQRPQNPRFTEDHRSRFSAGPASRLQILLVGLTVSMTWLSFGVAKDDPTALRRKRPVLRGKGPTAVSRGERGGRRGQALAKLSASARQI